MVVLEIQAKVSAGTTIRDACIAAKELGNRIGCDISFVFNGVTCIIGVNGDVYKLIEEYRKVLESKRMIAISRMDVKDEGKNQD